MPMLSVEEPRVSNVYTPKTGQADVKEELPVLVPALHRLVEPDARLKHAPPHQAPRVAEILMEQPISAKRDTRVPYRLLGPEDGQVLVGPADLRPRRGQALP